MRRHNYPLLIRALAAVSAFGLLGAAGCSRRVSGESARGPGNSPPSVDVVRARTGTLRPEPEYTGTTRPMREIAVRARTEGRLLGMTVDVGDGVRQGQVIGRVDDALLRQAVQQAESELLSRQAEAAAARTRVGDARTQVNQAQLDLSQKRADSKRFIQLYGQGYVPRRDAEQAKTAERVAAQVLRSEQQQVKNTLAEVGASDARVRAQRAVVAQEKERLSYANLVSPISGFITARLTESGNLLSPGAEVLRVGDFRVVQVDVEVSELELPSVSVGQTVRLTLDAMPGREFAARVDRISPQADPVSRLVPVTLTMANPDLKIGAGLLARVRFGTEGRQRVIIPEGALQGRMRAEAPAGAAGGSDGATLDSVFVLMDAPAAGPPAAPPAVSSEQRREPPAYTVQLRQVTAGEKADGQVEILAGLTAGERVVSRSSRPLTDGASVVVSALSQETLRSPAPPAERDQRPPPEPAVPRGTGAPAQGDPGRPGTGTSPARPVSPGTGGARPGSGDRPVQPAVPGSSARPRTGGEITAPRAPGAPGSFGSGIGAGGGR